MRIDVLTLFPAMFTPVLGSSILKRAIRKGVVRVGVHDLRRWSGDKHRKVDDRPYGGGPGMVMRPEPFFEAVEALKKRMVDRRSWIMEKPIHHPPSTIHRPRNVKPHIILLSPQGERLTQRKVQALARKEWLLLLCGHYEGVDERVRARLADEELSIGDYVLTCGELPAMVLIDSVVRLLPGSLGNRGSPAEESFCRDLLEYPHYTRPVEYRRMRVPEILLSGDAPQIAQWRRLQALKRTVKKRPDLIHGSQSSGDRAGSV